MAEERAQITSSACKASVHRNCPCAPEKDSRFLCICACHGRRDQS